MWNTMKLRELCDIARGGSPRPIKKYITNAEDGINWIKISDATASGKYIYKTKQKILKDGISSSRFVNKNDFILSNSMSFGRPYIMKTTGCVHDGWLVLSNYQSEVDADYLFYLLSSCLVIQQFEDSARGSTVRNLNIELVGAVIISYPPLKQQKRIVAKLDAVFAEIDKMITATKQKQKEVKMLKMATLATELNNLDDKSWNTVKLGDACEIQPQKKEAKEKLSDNMDVSFMGMNLLGIENKNAVTNLKKTLASVYKAYTYFADNDVLLAKITPCFENGKIGIACNLKNGVGFGSSEFVVFRCRDTIISEYLYYFLNQKTFREEGKRNMSGAVGHKRVTKEFIVNLLVPLPPLKQQKRIVAKLDAVFSEVKTINDLMSKQIINYQALKSKILAQELKGKAA